MPSYHVLLLLLGLNVLTAITEFTSRSQFFSSPGRLVKAREGGNAELDWTYAVSSMSPYGAKVFQVLFGIWDKPGYISRKLLVVQQNGHVEKRPGLETKLGWSGDIANCTCAVKVVIRNLTRKDDKYYGLFIELGLHRSPLAYWLHVMVLVPAKIISYTKVLETSEGNSALIMCKAEGNPTPVVEIQRNNRTLTNGSGLGVIFFHIRDVKLADGGHYACVASNEASRSRDIRSVMVKVQPSVVRNKDLTPPSTVKSDQTLVVVIAVVCGSVLIGVVSVLISFMLARRKKDGHMPMGTVQAAKA